jgi:hypothetical protein
MKYTDKLNKPITRKRSGLLDGEDAYQAEAKRFADEMIAKLPDLFKAHEVPEGNWVALALALAKAHVPGFKVINPAGRKTEWSIADKAEFKVDVDAVVVNAGNNLPITEAIKLACRSKAWIAKTKPMTLTALTKHYYTADLRFVEVVKSARAWQLHLEDEKIRESIVSTN